MISPPVKTVGRYELLESIGRGGMAVVYLARQLDLDRHVALKELRLGPGSDDPASTERFLREARMAGQMAHPNIVTVYEYFTHEETPYIAMEYFPRGSLRPAIAGMSLAQVAGVLEGLLAALDHAEHYGIIHRDLKPENLLVTDQGQIKVADFGIAKASTANVTTTLTAAGTTLGTPAYMAPEQAMARELGAYTDLYSVGVMAYEMLVGRTPFADVDEPMAIMLHHVNEPIPSAHEVRPDVDLELSAWIDRLLVKNPAERVQTASAAWDDLEDVVLRLLGSRWRRDARLLGGEDPGVSKPLTPAPFTATGEDTPVPPTSTTRRVATPPRRARTALRLGVPVLLAGAAVAGVLIGTGGDDSPSAGAGAGAAASPVPTTSAQARVTDTIAVGDVPDGIAVGEDAVWVVTRDKGELLRIDTEAREVIKAFPGVPAPDSVLVDDDNDAVYVTAQTDAGELFRFLVEPTVAEPVPVEVGPHPEGMAVGDEFLWVVLKGADAVRRIDRETGQPVGELVEVGDAPIGIDVKEDRVWVANSADGTVTLRRGGPDLSSAAVGTNPRDVTDAFGFAWVVVTDENAVVRLDRTTGEPVGDPIPVGDNPHKITADETFIWVTNSGDDSVSQIDPRTFAEVGRIPVGDGPLGIAAGAGAIWVTNAHSKNVSRIEPRFEGAGS